MQRKRRFIVFDIEGCLLMVFLCLVNIGIAEGCNSTACELPDCRCPSTSIPGDLHQAETPQMVFITWEGSVDEKFYEVFNKVFPSKKQRKNPNGCPVSSTVFVSSAKTDFCLVNKLWAEGHEIANQGLSKHTQEWWRTAQTDQWANEIMGLEANVVQKTRIAATEVSGWRSPYRQPGGDVQFAVLYEMTMQYDNTLLGSNDSDHPWWPFTLDYSLDFNVFQCNVWPCPELQYPGLWEVPLQKMSGINGTVCSSLQTCAPETADDTMQLLTENFDRHYETNRAPIQINLGTTWWLDENQKVVDGLNLFLDKINQEDDVWILSIQTGLEWVRNPVPVGETDQFSWWKCSSRPYDECVLPKPSDDGDESDSEDEDEMVVQMKFLGVNGTQLVIWQYVVLVVSLVAIIRYDRSTAKN